MFGLHRVKSLPARIPLHAFPHLTHLIYCGIPKGRTMNILPPCRKTQCSDPSSHLFLCFVVSPDVVLVEELHLHFQVVRGASTCSQHGCSYQPSPGPYSTLQKQGCHLCSELGSPTRLQAASLVLSSCFGQRTKKPSIFKENSPHRTNWDQCLTLCHLVLSGHLHQGFAYRCKVRTFAQAG